MNGPRINSDERGFTVNKTGAIVSVGAFILAVATAAVTVIGAFKTVQNEVKNLSAMLAMQSAERVQYERDTDLRLRSLEEGRVAASSELTSLRRDLTDFRVEVRTELQSISAGIDRIYRNGNGNP